MIDFYYSSHRLQQELSVEVLSVVRLLALLDLETLQVTLLGVVILKRVHLSLKNGHFLLNLIMFHQPFIIH